MLNAPCQLHYARANANDGSLSVQLAEKNFFFFLPSASGNLTSRRRFEASKLFPHHSQDPDDGQEVPIDPTKEYTLI